MKRSPIKRKRATKRRMKSPACYRRRCNVRAEIHGLCKSHAKSEADRLFSLETRARGRCEFVDFWLGKLVICRGVLQTCHFIPRSYHNTRWNPTNVACGCQAHHMAFDNRPLEKDLMIRKRLTDDGFDSLRRVALDANVDWRIWMIEVLKRGGEE